MNIHDLLQAKEAQVQELQSYNSHNYAGKYESLAKAYSSQKQVLSSLNGQIDYIYKKLQQSNQLPSS